MALPSATVLLGAALALALVAVPVSATDPIDLPMDEQFEDTVVCKKVSGRIVCVAYEHAGCTLSLAQMGSYWCITDLPY